MYRKRKNNILRGRRGSYPRISGARRMYGDDGRGSGGYGYMPEGRRMDAGGAYIRYDEKSAPKERICRVNASETRAGALGYRHERAYDRSGYGGRYREYRGDRPERRAGGSGGSGAATRGKRRVFSMAAWTASFIMLLNMLPADSPVSQAIAKYEESLPAMSLGLDELKNGPDDSQAGSGKEYENKEDNESSGGSADDQQAGGAVSASAEASEGAATSETSAAPESGAAAIENIALITSSTSASNGTSAETAPNEEAAGTGGADNNADKAAGSSKTGIVKAAADASGIVTFNGISLVLSDAQNPDAAAGAAASADKSSGSTSAKDSAAPPTTPNQTAVLTKTASDSAKTVKVSSATGSGDIIIYHTHATEAYAPVANAETTHSADAPGTVREAGNNLAAALKAKGYNVIHDTTLHDSPSYNKSYNRSLETLKKLLKEHSSPKLVIDFHRDAATASGKAKTAAVNGETVASFALVVGTKNDNYKNIRALADKIVKKSNELYPGLCTGVIEKPYKFNGYLSNSYILLELGNNANTITQINAAVPYLADVLTNTVQ